MFALSLSFARFAGREEAFDVPAASEKEGKELTAAAASSSDFHRRRRRRHRRESLVEGVVRWSFSAFSVRPGSGFRGRGN